MHYIERKTILRSQLKNLAFVGLLFLGAIVACKSGGIDSSHSFEMQWKLGEDGTCYALDKDATMHEASGDARYKPGPVSGCGCPPSAPSYIGDVLNSKGAVLCAYKDGRLKP